jgi:hypothetical protein
MKGRLPERAATELEGLGLRVRTVSLDASVALVPFSEVVSQTPSPGSRVLVGTQVELRTELRFTGARVPDVLGMFDDEARRLVAERGLVPEVTPPLPKEPVGEADSYPVLNAPHPSMGVITTQSPAPGTVLAFGRRVTLVRWSHSQRGRTPPSIHGLVYLRYGESGTGRCQSCHTGGCTRGGCHKRGPTSTRHDWPERGPG